MDSNKHDTLPDDKFINESYNSNPFFPWIWLFVVVAVAGVLWSISSQWSGMMEGWTSNRPFLQVSNRDMSVFLWQHPEYMRAHVRSKSGYLPAFNYKGTVAVDPVRAEEMVVAPPELLFRYHTWDRLLGGTVFNRPIAMREFAEFLDDDPQWAPQYWESAPAEYVRLVETLDPLSEGNLQGLSESALPRQVRQAFVGWKNYMFEGDEINDTRPTYGQLAGFLRDNPQHARHYWRNVVKVGDRYLKTTTFEQTLPGALVPLDELAPFLRVAFHNYQKAQSGL